MQCYNFVTILFGLRVEVEQHLLNYPAIPLAHISYIIMHVRERIALRVYSVEDRLVVAVTIVSIHNRRAIMEQAVKVLRKKISADILEDVLVHNPECFLKNEFI